MDEIDRFAMCLNEEDSPVKGKMLSIAYAYKDCFRRKWGKNYKEVKTNSKGTTAFEELD